jgi:hypothetical protein
MLIVLLRYRQRCGGCDYRRDVSRQGLRGTPSGKMLQQVGLAGLGLERFSAENDSQNRSRIPTPKTSRPKMIEMRDYMYMYRIFHSIYFIYHH